MKTGTNSVLLVPAFHTEACHSNHRNFPCIGSRSMSAQAGNVLEGAGIAPATTLTFVRRQRWSRG